MEGRALLFFFAENITTVLDLDFVIFVCCDGDICRGECHFAIKRRSGRNISYDTPNPGMSNNVGAFSLPKIWKFIFYMSMAETGRYGGNKLHIPRRNHGAAVALRSVLVLS